MKKRDRNEPENESPEGQGAPDGGAGGEGADPAGGNPERASADRERLAALEKERDEFRDRYQRALADQENQRKRLHREMQETRQYAVSELARELLDVMDNLRRALEGVAKERSEDPVVTGVRMVLEQLQTTLGRHGVKPVEAEGQPFDPMWHEALLQDERDDVAPGTVTEELVRGYRLGDRLLRAAAVRVAKPKAGGGRAEPEAPSSPTES